jgi:hypothetical protein
VRFSVLAITICLGGCAAGHSIVQSLPEQQAPQSAPQQQAPQAVLEPNYRQIVANDIGTIFPNPAELGVLEISNVRPVDHFRGPAWLTCLRIHAEDAAQEYALFILDDKVIDVRVGVAIDRCRQQAYSAYDLASFIQPKVPPKMQAKKAAH